MDEGEVGEIIYFLEDHVNWNIPQFSDLPKQNGARIWSPKFGYWNAPQKYDIAPPGWTGDNRHVNWIQVSLTSQTNDGMKCGATDSVRVGVTDESGKEISVCDCEWNCSYGGFDGKQLVEKKELFDRQRGDIPGGYLRLFCESPKAPDQILDVAIQTDVGFGIGVLSDNIKDLLITKRYADFTVKVHEREFSVHRLILRARSPVFDAMLTHDLKENNENLIELDDFEPEVFEEFLHFIYSGKTENITCENVFGLYYAADKYNVPDLKPECINFLKTNLTLETIFDVICLCTKHNETELLDLAIIFFANNLDEILTSCKWLLFLKENPVESNELYIKALKLGFEKKRAN